MRHYGAVASAGPTPSGPRCAPTPEMPREVRLAVCCGQCARGLRRRGCLKDVEDGIQVPFPGGDLHHGVVGLTAHYPYSRPQPQRFRRRGLPAGNLDDVGQLHQPLLDRFIPRGMGYRGPVGCPPGDAEAPVRGNNDGAAPPTRKSGSSTRYFPDSAGKFTALPKALFGFPLFPAVLKHKHEHQGRHVPMRETQERQARVDKGCERHGEQRHVGDVRGVPALTAHAQIPAPRMEGVNAWRRGVGRGLVSLNAGIRR